MFNLKRAFLTWNRANQADFARAVSEELDKKADKSELENIGAVDTSDKVSKSGDVMTGDLTLGGDNATSKYISVMRLSGTISIGGFITDNGQGLIFGSRNSSSKSNLYAMSNGPTLGFYPLINNQFCLGNSIYKWTKVFAAKLNNGEDIEIPATAGTLALLGDIPDSVAKSGDTMTGQLKINLDGSPNRAALILSGNPDGSRSVGLVSHFEGNTFDIQFVNATRFSFSPTMFYPSSNNTATLGFTSLKWKNIYTAKLNNGADIEIPNKAGTMALVSDIEDVLRQHGLIE